MGSKNIKQAINRYLQEMLDLYRQDADNNSGITAYCGLLKDLLYSVLEFLPGNFTRKNVAIEILEIPVGLRLQMPCMRIWDGKNKIYGYIEILGPGTGKEEIDAYPLSALYKQVFPNLLVTNFFEFRYYRQEQKVCTARPLTVSHIREISDKLKALQPKVFLKALQHFMGYSDKKSEVLSFIDLQKRLALKTFYLKEYVLTPLMDHLLETRSKGELVRLYRAYCYFFDLELSAKEFSAFLAHAIVDGFIRAAGFHSTMNSNPGSPFSRRRVFEFAKLNRMTERRQALFKYLSQAPGDDGFTGPVQWLLDDLCVLLANYDFQKMGHLCRNICVIDGALLQWEIYFFIPYYDRAEERKRVKKLLIKAGIFSRDKG